MKPNVPPKAVAHLNAHLEESRNSDEETLTIAASLLESAPTDTVTVHKTLLVVSRRSDPGLAGGVLRQLGLNKTRVPEALDFIGTNLNHADPNVRHPRQTRFQGLITMFASSLLCNCRVSLLIQANQGTCALRQDWPYSPEMTCSPQNLSFSNNGTAQVPIRKRTAHSHNFHVTSEVVFVDHDKSIKVQ